MLFYQCSKTDTCCRVEEMPISCYEILFHKTTETGHSTKNKLFIPLTQYMVRMAVMVKMLILNDDNFPKIVVASKKKSLKAFRVF